MRPLSTKILFSLLALLLTSAASAQVTGKYKFYCTRNGAKYRHASGTLDADARKGTLSARFGRESYYTFTSNEGPAKITYNNGNGGTMEFYFGKVTTQDERTNDPIIVDFTVTFWSFQYNIQCAQKDEVACAYNGDNVSGCGKVELMQGE